MPQETTPQEATPQGPPRQESPGPQAGHLRTVAVVIYATLLLLALAIPQSIVSWIGDMKSIEMQETLLPAAETLQRLSRQIGIDAPYTRARAAFLALTSKEDH
jgi:hypothetical protein